VKRLMISPTVSETAKPFRLSFPNVYSTIAVKMLVR
jgi:hypothetical protein